MIRGSHVNGIKDFNEHNESSNTHHVEIIYFVCQMLIALQARERESFDNNSSSS
jgi:hypothetical protein